MFLSKPLLVVIYLVSVTILSAQAPERYEFQILELPEGVDYAIPYDVNNRGVIIGEAGLASGSWDVAPILWDPSPRLLPVPDLPYQEGSVSASINDRGDISGTYTHWNLENYNGWQNRNGQFKLYPEFSWSGNINNQGVATGGERRDGQYSAGTWVDGKLVPLPERGNAVPWFIDDRGRLAGFVRSGDYLTYAAKWASVDSPAQVRYDLHESIYEAVGANGALAGRFTLRSTLYNFYELNGVTTILPDTLPWVPSISAIDGYGRVIATLYDDFYNQRGLIWSGGDWVEASTMLTNSEGGRYMIRSLNDITDDGRTMVGTVFDRHTYKNIPARFVAVPEPATVLGFLVGPSVLVVRRLRAQRSSQRALKG